jgi:hypothetical protein
MTDSGGRSAFKVRRDVRNSDLAWTGGVCGPLTGAGTIDWEMILHETCVEILSWMRGRPAVGLQMGNAGTRLQVVERPAIEWGPVATCSEEIERGIEVRIRKLSMLSLAVGVLTFSMVSCEGDSKPSSSEQPKVEQPKGEHPKVEHPKGEHPR